MGAAVADTVPDIGYNSAAITGLGMLTQPVINKTLIRLYQTLHIYKHTRYRCVILYTIRDKARSYTGFNYLNLQGAGWMQKKTTWSFDEAELSH